MKQTSTKQLGLFILFFAFTFSSFAQDEINTEFINRMNYVFGSLEKNRVPTGLLLDYSMEFADLKSYNGVLTDSNKTNEGLLRDIYTTLTMSAIHSNAGRFYNPDYLDSLWQTQRKPGVITLSSIHYKYSRFKDNAASAGLITVSNDKFYDRYINGTWQNPYQTETVFAVAPSLHIYYGRKFQVALSTLYFTNDQTEMGLEVDFKDGTGYRPISIDEGAVNVSYADTGTKTWVFRLTLTNGTKLYSHTEIKILPEPNKPYSAGGTTAARFSGNNWTPQSLTADRPFNGQAGRGWITVDYANSDLKLRKPLIVAEGFDPAHLLSPELQFGYSNFNSFIQLVTDENASQKLRDLLQSNIQQYDIIYVDWATGTDYLQRNALLLERVIRWVNEQKAIDGSTQPNVVLGQSMGGVISRWALRDMENRGLNHQTRLFISWDSPQQGANIPLAYQHGARHANNLFVQSAIPILYGGTNTIRIVKNALNLLDVPAAKQMLYNRVLDNGSLDNAEHDAWQLELRNLGYPTQSRNIAVSNGSECGIAQGFQPNADLLNVNGRGNTRFLTDIIGSFTGPGLGFWGGLSLIALKPQFLLGILPGRNDFIFELNCKAQPVNATTQIYKGKITYRKKILWLINVNTTITDRSRNADASVLAIDGTPGGMYDTEFNMKSQDFKNWAIKYSITATNIPQFNFVPTTSSLDIGRGNTVLTLANYQARYVGGYPPASPLNSPFANFTTAFNTVLTSAGFANNNEHHIQMATRNGNFVADELNGNINVRTNCSAFCGNGSISGPDLVCNNPGTYTAPFGNGVTYNWSVSNTLLVTRTANGNSCTITRNGSSSGLLTITVQISGACGATTLTKTITVGAPEPSLSVTLSCPEANAVANAAGVNSYVWTLYSGGTTEVSNGTANKRFGYISGNASICAKYTNTCGTSPEACRPVYCPPAGPRIVVAPNPVTNNLRANFKELPVHQSKKVAIQPLIYEAVIADKSGIVKKRVHYNNGVGNVNIYVGDLAKDIYVIRLFDGKEWNSEKIIIQ